MWVFCGQCLHLLLSSKAMVAWWHIRGITLINRPYGMTAFEYPGMDQRKFLKVLVDVGGGIGVTLDVITSKYPHIKGINFDLPHVLTDAPTYSGVKHVGEDINGSYHASADEDKVMTRKQKAENKHMTMAMARLMEKLENLIL
ncbi:hypothetical protein Pint_36743 [Pistacia integerrima]|nr:hypothetical protein Pint_36743 [Pistacia integerrima]